MRKNIGKKPWFYPLPVLIIGTYDENGVPDTMNAAYGGLYTADMIEFCIAHSRKTFRNLQKTGPLPSALQTRPIWPPAIMWGWSPATTRRTK